MRRKNLFSAFRIHPSAFLILRSGGALPRGYPNPCRIVTNFGQFRCVPGASRFLYSRPASHPLDLAERSRREPANPRQS